MCIDYKYIDYWRLRKRRKSFDYYAMFHIKIYRLSQTEECK